MAMVMISVGIDEPNIDRMISAKTSSGIDSMTSTTRERTWSITVAADRGQEPSVVPIRKDRSVVTSATPMVMRAP